MAHEYIRGENHCSTLITVTRNKSFGSRDKTLGQRFLIKFLEKKTCYGRLDVTAGD